MNFLFFSVILILSFYFLARVCDKYFVDSLDKIADRLKMSSDAAGATLMAMGSSAPELFVSAIALLKPGGHEAIGMGTIIGSALFNILVIIGASATVKKAKLAWQPVIRDTIFYSLAILLLLVAFRDGQIELGEAILFVGFYFVYVLAVVNWKKILPHKDILEDYVAGAEKREKKAKLKFLTIPLNKALALFFPKKEKYIQVFFISIAVIAGLSWVLVESAVAISGILGIPAAIVALTVLAAGTSIPDLISSVVVARQGRGGMAISNAIGSNIFDILFGLGVPWFLVLSFRQETIFVSTENLWSSIILLFATVFVIFFLLLAKKWKIGRRSGYFLIILYIFYLIWAITNI